MYNLRKEDLSIYLYIKDYVLKSFIELQEKDTLSYFPEASSSISKVYQINTTAFPNPFEVGRGMVYFDENFDDCLVNCTSCSGTPEQSNRVIVYDSDLNVINENLYMVDYVDGRIVTTSTLTPAYIDYYWNYVSVVDEWHLIPAANPPIVVIDLHGTDKKGYQLGGGKLVGRKGALHIFASSAAERNDLTEVLYDALYLKSCPFYTFSSGSVLDFDGTFYGRRDELDKSITLFSRETVTGVSNLAFENVSSRNISLPVLSTFGGEESVLSDLNAYRAKITFDLESYTST